MKEKRYTLPEEQKDAAFAAEPAPAYHGNAAIALPEDECAEEDIDWNKLKIYKQRGTCIIRSAHSSFLLNGKQITADTWSHDFDIPRFIGEGRDYIERYLYPDDPNNTTSRKDGNN